MDIMTAIKTRRSIRYFTEEQIDEKILNTILEAASCAPSAHNKRPWHFVVIREKDELSRISKIEKYHRPIGRAACCIVVCGDKNIQEVHDLLVNDCSAAIENLLLASHGLGLGAVWCGVIPDSNVYKYLIENLQLPVEIAPMGLIALGHPKEEMNAVERLNMSKIHYEKW